jgi:hypothetical protein
MYVQRVCRGNYTGQIKEETTNNTSPELIMEIEKCWKP